MPNKCKKCNYISLGKINKYIFLILLDALLYIFIGFIEGESKFFAEENLHPIIYIISDSLGSSLSFILLIIYNIRNKRKNKIINLLLLEQNNINKISWKQKFL